MLADAYFHGISICILRRASRRRDRADDFHILKGDTGRSREHSAAELAVDKKLVSGRQRHGERASKGAGVFDVCPAKCVLCNAAVVQLDG